MVQLAFYIMAFIIGLKVTFGKNNLKPGATGTLPETKPKRVVIGGWILIILPIVMILIEVISVINQLG